MNIEDIYDLFLQSGRVFTDSRNAVNGGIFIALRGDRFNANNFAIEALNNGADYAIVDDPSLDGQPRCIFVQNSLVALQDLARFHRDQIGLPVLAITGTNGKTTTKELISTVLSTGYNICFTQGNLNNHIGVPLTLLTLKESHDIAVIEMGASKSGDIAELCDIAHPNFALITNVGKAHLEGFGSFAGVINTKKELYDYISEFGKGVFVNTSNPILREIVPQEVENFTFGTDGTPDIIGAVASNDINLTAKVRFKKGWLYLQSHLTGEYNLENILAAARVGLHFGIDPLTIQKSISNYIPTNNRSQWEVGEKNSVLLDCYNANPTSMRAALANFNGLKRTPKVIIIGDMLELGDASHDEHQKIVELVQDMSFDESYYVGKEFSKCKPSNSYLSVESLIEDIKTKNYEGYTFLVKGSRGIQLESISQLLLS